MKKLKFQKRINILNINMLSKLKLNNSSINLINVDYNFSKPFEKISRKSNLYIENCFKVAFEIIEKGLSNKLINGPISKKSFLSKKYLGITEYISDKFFIKNNAMLIYNNNLSVCPITTHLPLKVVSKQINKKIIKSKINLIFKFYKKYLKKKPKIAVLGLNPHCESIDKFNEDEMIIKPVIKQILKKVKKFTDLILNTI